jgi:ubiquinone biosynthesis protein UbiJ
LVEFITPDAGHQAADLVLRVNESSPLELAKTVLQGAKPAIRIEGDVQLAAEVNWLIDHVRWDLEEDLSRLLGDARAHVVMGVARQMAQALRQWMARSGANPGARSDGRVGFP